MNLCVYEFKEHNASFFILACCKMSSFKRCEANLKVRNLWQHWQIFFFLWHLIDFRLWRKTQEINSLDWQKYKKLRPFILHYEVLNKKRERKKFNREQFTSRQKFRKKIKSRFSRQHMKRNTSCAGEFTFWLNNYFAKNENDFHGAFVFVLRRLKTIIDI